MRSGDCQHPTTCECRQALSADVPVGAMLMARSAGVRDKMAVDFEPDPEREELFPVRGEGWLGRLQELIGRLSPLERESLLAVAIDAEGRSDPWQAIPIDAFVNRVSSPWLPALLNESQLRAYFQPIVRVASLEICAFEALMRARVDGQLISAGRIIDAARAHNALFQFDRQAREAAIRQGWSQMRPGEKLFINFAPSVIYDPNVCLQATWKVASEINCDLSALVFEVVESETFPQIEHLRSILETYRDHGANVALDDLGSGKTALTFIDELQPDLIKLDRKLLPLRPRPHDIRLVKGLTEYAHGRGIEVLIEGVETREQLDAVLATGADLVQGWLFGRPAPEPQRRLDLDVSSPDARSSTF